MLLDLDKETRGFCRIGHSEGVEQESDIDNEKEIVYLPSSAGNNGILALKTSFGHNAKLDDKKEELSCGESWMENEVNKTKMTVQKGKEDGECMSF